MRENKKLCLGIESTAHTFGIGIADSGGKIYANANSHYVPYASGIHPREAAQHHAKNAPKVLNKALEEADVSLSEIDVIAFSIGPGMGPSLRTGATVARTLAISGQKPLVGVNHSVAHMEIGRLICKCEDPIVLYVAGGNTLIASYLDGRYRILGETLDIAAGNCLDVFGLEICAGRMPEPEKLAARGSKFIPLPYAVKGMDLSFTGLLTSAVRMVRDGSRPEDVAMSITETVYGMLTEVTERAITYTGKKEVLLVGGLAKSRRLTEMVQTMASEHGANVFVVPDEYAGDNGAMIAWTGMLHYLSGDTIQVDESSIKPRQRLDEVRIPFRYESSGGK